MNRVLIANRGAIAVRIIRTLKRMGIESVAIYHHDERDSIYTKDANLAVSLGKGSLTDTFLNIDKIISIALEVGCDAIHPGYGFLSENHLFAQACEANNITFIGPHSDAIQKMGLKSTAKQIAVEANVPVLISEEISDISSIDTSKLKFPLLIKAVAGGGGKGLKIVHEQAEVLDAVKSAQREALQYFGNDKVMLEPYIEDSRHIEVQILGNTHGEIIHLFERECSIQRNHQKIIEEAPSPGLSDGLRKQLCDAAIRFASQLKYTGAGTVEFLVSGEKFWFLEMNTRIQVEHAVTELITGFDIVEEQVKIARGESFSKQIKTPVINGHAVEVRIYAENPYHNFQPSAGTVQFLNLPSQVRFDTFLEEGTSITPHFDSLLGKLVVHSHDRHSAIEQLRSKLSETKIYGIKTNTSYLSHLLANEKFVSDIVSTRFIKLYHNDIVNEAEKGRNAINLPFLLGAFLYNHFIRPATYNSIWGYAGYRSINLTTVVKIEKEDIQVRLKAIANNSFSFDYNNENVTLLIEKLDSNSMVLNVNGSTKRVFFTRNDAQPYDLYGYDCYVYRLSSPAVLRMTGAFLNKTDKNTTGTFNQINSPLFGKVVGVKVNTLQKVKKGDLLVVIESMKTENNILAEGEGVVSEVFVSEGSQVAENSPILNITSTIK